MMTVIQNRWIDHVAGLFLGSLAGAVYFLTLGAAPYPGQAADMVVQHMGLLPYWQPTHPIWGWILNRVGHVPGYASAHRMNGVSAVCGALAVWVLYELMVRALAAAVQATKNTHARSVAAARIGATASALTLIFCVPFWMASNRALPHTFDVLLLLLAFAGLAAYARTGKRWLLPVFALAYGVGVVESSTLILFAPLFGSVLLFLMWHHDDLNGVSVSLLVLLGGIGLLAYLLMAGAFYGSDGYVLREYRSFWQIILLFWRDQIFELTRSLPRVGWLIVLCMTVVPWFTVLLVARRALNEERDWAFYMLHIVLTAVAAIVVLNLDFAPWPMMRGRLAVTPYVLAASVVGYLAAYWFLLPFGWWPDTENAALKRLRPIAASAGVVVVFVPLLMAPFRNVAEADARPARAITEFAESILDCLDGRTWLLTNGGMDNYVLLAAAEKGRTVRVVNLRQGANDVYGRYIAGFFDSIRLKNLARLGMGVLLQEWLAKPGIERDVAILNASDIWIGARYTVVPNKLVYLGTRDPEGLDPEALWERHREFWDRFPIDALSADRAPGWVGRYQAYGVRHSGRLANNLGVLLEDLDAPAAAVAAYRAARDLDPSNISALLNLAAMIERGRAVPGAEAIIEEARAVSQDVEKRVELWSLAGFYGYVRSPAAFADLGWTWAFSGRPGMAASGLQKAIDLLPEERRTPAREALASLYLLEGEAGKGEAVIESVLAADPDRPSALLSKAKALAQRGETEAALLHVSRAEAAGGDPDAVRFTRAFAHFFAGEYRQAREILEGVTRTRRDWLPALTMLAEVALATGDDASFEQTLRRIRGVDRGEAFAATLEGRKALMNRNLEVAADRFEQALVRQPRNPRLIEQVLRLDVALGRRTKADQHARRLIAIDLDNPLANHIMGIFQLEAGDLESAEDYLRRSLSARPSAEVRNDLAWVLAGQGELDEAEQLVRAALDENAELSAAWDTLGVVLARKGQLAQAETALQRALSLSGGSPAVLLNMAELQVRKGNGRRALDLLDALGEKREMLSLDDVERMDELRRRATALP